MVEATQGTFEEENKGGTTPREEMGEAGETGEVYDDNEATNFFGSEFSSRFTVRNPQDSHGHIVYEVSGVDKEGDFMVKRRYNDFHSLHDHLTKRWPGIIVP